MREETVERALEVCCPTCGVNAGLECVHPSGQALLDVEGIPVHASRMEGDW